MEPAEIIQYITTTFDGVETAEDHGNTFFFYGPERMMPFATLSANDAYDAFSNLARPGVFRLNIGVGKATFEALAGAQTGHDFTALDQIMQHPVYGKQMWVCVLNPSAATFEKVKPLLAEAYARDVKKHTKKQAE